MSVLPDPVCVDDTDLVPIVVDLDGTLVSTDTLIESIIGAVKTSPVDLLRLPLWLLQGRAYLKKMVAMRSGIAIARLPYNETLLAHLRIEKARGRRIVLATAAHATIARGVAEHLDLFDDVLASDGRGNLKGHAKLLAIRDTVGHAFVYAGDNAADLPIWRQARGAILVGVSRRMAETVRRDTRIEREFQSRRIDIRTWMKALRVHQWVKNLLLFVPLLTSFSFLDIGKLVPMLVAFLAFSGAASATYVLNDLWDLESDRAHPTKRLRPFASGLIPIVQGMAVAGCVLAAAVALAWWLAPQFLCMLLAYLVLTSFYSLVFKGYVLIDVLALALLYTFRIIAGSAVAAIGTTSWLLAFSFFLFLSLALVKRCSELLSLHRIGRQETRGRDYRVSDLAVLWPFGAGSALSAVVVFGLFISVPETQERYAAPRLLWLVAIGLFYWLGRLWIKTSRGEMHDDPIIFACKDRGSRIVVVAMILATLAAHYLSLGPLQ